MVKRTFILDTSALITYLANEKGANDVLKLLPECKIPFICLSELYYLVWNKKGKAEADKIYGITKSWNLPILYPNERVILNAGRLKAVYKVGISDSYIAAFVLEDNSQLITKDRDYKILEKEIKVLMLADS